MTAPVLLAVIEVPFEERVRCAADGCGHSVYRRVHLVRVDEFTKVYGSDCFSRLFGSTPTGKEVPKYTGGAGRSLTPDERELLKENTERLIERFEREFQTAIAAAEQKRSLLASRLDAMSEAPIGNRREVPRSPTTGQRAQAEVEARKSLAAQFLGVNFDLPGFKGLLRMEIDKILRENAA